MVLSRWSICSFLLAASSCLSSSNVNGTAILGAAVASLDSLAFADFGSAAGELEECFLLLFLAALFGVILLLAWDPALPLESIYSTLQPLFSTVKYIRFLKFVASAFEIASTH